MFKNANNWKTKIKHLNDRKFSDSYILFLVVLNLINQFKLFKIRYLIILRRVSESVKNSHFAMKHLLTSLLS